MKFYQFLPAVLLLLAPALTAAEPLPRSAPESEGVSSMGLLRLVEALDAEVEGMHSLMVLRRGRVIAEGWWGPYAADRKHVLYSLSKSFTSTAVGLAVAEGKISLDDKVLGFFPDDAPKDPSENVKAMRVRDLLLMAAGHETESPTAKETMSPKSFLAHPVPFAPGTHFRYNTAATFMCSAIVQKSTGLTVLEYLNPRLFEPLGIGNPVWDKNFQGINLGGYGLRVRTEDIAKFGQLYLGKGEWKGKRILSPEWVEMATSKQIDNGSDPNSDWNQGYGFQFWRCRHDAYRGDGAFGQYCVVLPEQEMVVAITGGLGNMGAVLGILWDRLLPAIAPAPLAADAEGTKALRDELAALELRPAEGDATSEVAAKVFGKSYRFESNPRKLESISLFEDEAAKSIALAAKFEGTDVRFRFGHRQWLPGRGPFGAGNLADFPDEPVAGTYGWISDTVCELRLCAVETPFVATWRLRFEGDSVTLESEVNVAFGATVAPPLTGKHGE
jgi:CubicO group peptidase (beta-lactamase class C family)